LKRNFVAFIKIEEAFQGLVNHSVTVKITELQGDKIESVKFMF